VAGTVRTLQFGANIDPSADQFEPAVRLARVADDLGFDLIGIQDHPYQRRFLDTWSLIAALIPQTERVRFFANVSNLPLRPPAMLAKAAASLDVMSGGRMELGLGAGGFWDAIAAMGGPRRSPAEALEALDEAISVIRMVWSGERGLKIAGKHYRLQGLNSGPVPVHDMEIWVGGYRPRMLALIGRVADGWIPSLPYAPPEEIPEAQRRIDRAAIEAGRDPGAIHRIYNLSGRIAAGPARALLDGPSAHWVETLTTFAVELRMDTFMFWPAEDPERQLEVFAKEVAPGVRAASRAVIR
jgi:alkanesulfonate monooxygenase SsuD/methylene tetrahydromethanopterin reductase-like flavin-dependent oxidoreductase (luciferase family)